MREASNVHRWWITTSDNRHYSAHLAPLTPVPRREHGYDEWRSPGQPRASSISKRPWRITLGVIVNDFAIVRETDRQIGGDAAKQSCSNPTPPTAGGTRVSLRRKGC